MTPDERQLLSGLFDRIRGASNQSRDREAETFIGDAVKTQPYAPYLLAQTVIVQDQALRAANDKLQELESKVQELQRAQPQQGGGDTSFLGSIGRSIFGQGQADPQQPPRSSVPSAGGFGPQGYGQQTGQGYGQQAPQGGFGGQQPQGGPWGQGTGQQPGQGGGFLKGALGAAAGVAGGVLLANSISGLFRGNSLGIGAGMPGLGGMGGGFGGGGETIVNNYYDNDAGGGGVDNGGYDDGGGYENGGGDNGGFDNAADFGPDDGGSGSDDGYNV